ncbi:MAG: hypothetical protein ABSF25_14715 [Bryobacteraceae bacterium]
MIGIFGLAGGFVVISPGIRQAGLENGLRVTAFLNSHSPYSYIGVTMAMVGAMILLARSAKVRH